MKKPKKEDGKEKLPKKKEEEFPKDEEEPIIGELKAAGVPPGVIKEVSTFMQIAGRGFSPIERKISAESIDKIIVNQDKRHQRIIDDGQKERNYNYKILLTIFCFVLILLGFFHLIGEFSFLKDNWFPILSCLIGFAGGFGFGKYSALSNSK
ncbi:hypothetical protein AMJ80_05360 [bacterium SM23_31]|nr:MAG: hypothetical protein AMJ80_05360 [bacterium SM23_31]